MTSPVGKLEERLDIVSLVSRKHAVLETLGDDGAESVPFFPRYVWWGGLVRNRVVESEGELVEPLQIKGDL